jgi:hypothetical protein
LFGCKSLSPDHPLVFTSCRLPGADKKEQKSRGKEQKASRQHELVLPNVLLGCNCNGALLSGALHSLFPCVMHNDFQNARI